MKKKIMLYVSKSAAARILKADPQITKLGTIHTVREMKNAVLVTYNHNRNRCSTFISYKKFQADFISLRQEGARQPCTITTVNRFSGSFLVKRAGSENAHCTTVNANGFSCSCNDFQNQVEKGNGFTHPVCNHAIAIAFKFGYSSLREYIQDLREDAKAA